MRLWRRENPTDLKLLEPLGEGLTSQVYKAIRKHAELGIEQTVAVKVLNSRKAVHALKNEIDILTQVESLHCVRLLGWADLKQGPAILLEYLDGTSLLDLCAFGKVTAPIADEIVAQLQMGLRDLHQFGIRHGDLSAKNIFITNRGIVKILDFGFSVSANESTDRELFGTPQFHSVEGWAGETLTMKADLFSLGILREDLIAGTVLQHGLNETWQRRATTLCEKNELLRRNPAEREFLDINSRPHIKVELASLVKQIQNKKRAFKNTTRLIGNALAAVPRSLGAARWLSSSVFFMVFFFLSNLQPASLLSDYRSPRKTNLYIDVRSQDWAQVRLYIKDNGELQEIGRQEYAPFKFRKLQSGNYEMHWNSRGRTGIIFVQLNQSRRILIR